MAKTTKAQLIHHAISDEIIHGRLPPGSVLDETIIAVRYGVSRTPIREAIRQLAAIGLVNVHKHRSAVVADFAPAEIDDMFAVMGELEALCARWAARSMTPQQRRDLLAMHESSAAFVAAEARDGYVEFNQRFHEAIYLGSRNNFLIELTLAARNRCSPFRRLQFESRGRLADSFHEHGAIVIAIQRGNATDAEMAMRAHIRDVRSALEIVAKEQAAPVQKPAKVAKKIARPIHKAQTA